MAHHAMLYQQMILDHNRRPKNFGKLSDCSHQSEGFNPLCGDHLSVYLKLNDQNIIDDIRFDGSGCAISKASASLMTTAIKGKSKEDAQMIFHDFMKLLKGEALPSTKNLGKLTIFSGIKQHASRVKCAALIWHALNGALQHESTVSTENNEETNR